MQNPLKVDQFCDSYAEREELDNTHPQIIYDKIQHKEKREFKEAYERASYKLNAEDPTPAALFNKFLFQYTYPDWFVRVSDHHLLQPTSAIVLHLSQYYPNQDFCRKNHPELDL